MHNAQIVQMDDVGGMWDEGGSIDDISLSDESHSESDSDGVSEAEIIDV